MNDITHNYPFGKEMPEEVVKTYKDPRNMPYILDDREKSALHFCSSQEMVQGFEQQNKGKKMFFAATRFLIEAMYKDWNSKETLLKQQFETERLIKEYCLIHRENEILENSLLNNISNLTDSFRLFSELGLENISKSGEMSPDQQLAVELYGESIKSKDSPYHLKDPENVSYALMMAYINKETEKNKRSNKKETDTKKLENELKTNMNIIVFDGIFRFSPILLRAINTIRHSGCVKRIVYIFNFRHEKELASFYQCWLNLYSKISSNIHFEDEKDQSNIIFNGNENNYQLALALGRAAEGISPYAAGSSFDPSKVELLEFENLTEFSGYVAQRFDEALRYKRDNNKKGANLSYMSEMFYSSSRKANNILKAFFPEQFGIMSLLSFPIAQFFFTLVDMWNNTTECLELSSVSQLSICIRGLLNEPADAVSKFYRLEPYISHCSTVEQAIRVLCGIIDMSDKDTETMLDLKMIPITLKNDNDVDKLDKSFVGEGENWKEFYKRILGKKKREYPMGSLSDSYAHRLDIYSEDIDAKDIFYLIRLLCIINQLAISLFGTKKGRNKIDSFKNFLKRYTAQEGSDIYRSEIAITESVLRAAIDDAEEEIAKIVGVYDPKDTQQVKKIIGITFDKNTNTSAAKWIIHDLVQIDGDILVTPNDPEIREKRKNHFCFLSNEDMLKDSHQLYPWPLEQKFFESIDVAESAKWMIELFRASGREFRSFPKYALIYGILFSEGPVVLSYVKHVDERDDAEHTMLTLFRLLGLSPQNYLSYTKLKSNKVLINAGSANAPAKDTEKSLLLSNCFYRYVVESMVQDKVRYYDRFLIVNHIKNLIINAVINEEIDRQRNVAFGNTNKLDKSQINYNILENKIEMYTQQFSFLTDAEKYEIINDCNIMLESSVQHWSENNFKAYNTDWLENWIIGKEIQPGSFKSVFNNYLDTSNNYINDFMEFKNDWIKEQKDRWIDSDVLKKYKQYNRNSDSWVFNCSFCPIKSLCPKAITSN